MTDLRNAILATLAYYDVIDFPLTSFEIFRYLMNPGRVEKIRNGVGDISLRDVISGLDQLIGEGRLIEQHGKYFLSGDRLHTAAVRNEREVNAAYKWKKLLRRAWWLQAVPYVRGLWASGSLAMSSASEQSDFDFIVVAKAGRLYTCRLLLSLAAWLMGSLRRRRDTTASDKFCFNHYLTDASLRIANESLYTARIFTTIRPVLSEPGLLERFYLENLWLNKYVYTFRPGEEIIRQAIRLNGLLKLVARAAEVFLDLPCGIPIEYLVRWRQVRRIRRNPETFQSGGRVLWADGQLEFHPRSAERSILERYNQKILELGTFWNYQESDSGLFS